MVTQPRPLAWNFETPDVNNLLAPIQQGVRDYRAAEQRQVENNRAERGLAIQEGQFGLQKQKFDSDREAQEVQRIGNMARVIDEQKDPNQRAAMIARLYAGSPAMKDSLVKYGVDPNDHVAVPKFLMAQAGQYDPTSRAKSAAEIERIRAATGLAQAQAGYYRARSTPGANPATTAEQPAASPLDGAGIDEQGNMVMPGPRNALAMPLAPPGFVPSVPSSPAMAPGILRAPDFSGRMNLGGPMDDIDRSMRLDEGRALPQGVRVAQAGGMPPLMSQARERAFGPAGVTSDQVPGIVTDAGRNRRTDVPATREMQGQRALESVPQQDRDRLVRMLEDQRRWTAVFGPARAGFYYLPNGKEVPKGERGYKGDEEMQKVIQYQLSAIDEAMKPLRAWSGNPIAYVGRTVAGLTNSGEIGQAYADLALAATGPVYALSGKQATVAEMIKFAKTFEPQPGEDISRSEMKIARLKKFYHALSKTKAGLGGDDPLDPSHVQRAYWEASNSAREQSSQRRQEDLGNRTVPPTRQRQDSNDGFGPLRRVQ